MDTFTKASSTRVPALPIAGTAAVMLICLLTLGTSATYAQTSALKQCATEHSKAMSNLRKSRPASLPGLEMLFDPDAAKGQQILQVWTDCVNGKSAPPMAFTTLNGESYDKASLTGKILDHVDCVSTDNCRQNGMVVAGVAKICCPSRILYEPTFTSKSTF